MHPLARKRLMAKLLNELPVLRAKLGISQAELAQQVGISRQTLSGIETKKQTMTWVTFMALLAFFENNKESLSQLSLIGFFEDEDFIKCLTVEKRR